MSFLQAVGPRIQNGASSSFTHPAKESKNQEASFIFNPTPSCLNMLKNCAFGEVRKGLSLQDITTSFGSITNLAVDVKMLGGNYVLVFFESREALLSCLKHKEAWKEECFLFIKEWEVGDCATQRECWLNIHGVPPHAWCDDFFSMIAIHFGTLVKSLNPLSSSNHLDVARIQITTPYREPIADLLSGEKIPPEVVYSDPVLSSEGSCSASSISDQDAALIEAKAHNSQDLFGILDTIRYLEKGKTVANKGTEWNQSFGQMSMGNTRLVDNKKVSASKSIIRQQNQSCETAPLSSNMAAVNVAIRNPLSVESPRQVASSKVGLSVTYEEGPEKQKASGAAVQNSSHYKDDFKILKNIRRKQ
ncbi:hypothetical protein Tsubulata_021021 [Turnera subulata]|uniref:DUF4283 domain-containing protein n=1 Tax=Turnera subulata TaxID=218843 RepID=A0A9Q0J9K2_9ROSI|nr:hypothetical protein Tsubulata_021021 [Turnera subulata]